ncbi:MAG: HAMP domain-containing sensor histidine kinase [Spongiibacteraceae bacterium]
MTVVSWLLLWLLNTAVVLVLYNFTLNTLVKDLTGTIQQRIEKRLSTWPKQLPQHAGVTQWLYRQFAVEIADMQDCVALVDREGELQLSNIDIAKRAEFSFRDFRTATYTGHRWRAENEGDTVTCLVTDHPLTDGGHLFFGVPFDGYLATIRRLNDLRFWGLLATGTFSLLAAAFISGRALRGMRMLSHLCDRVAAGDLKQRMQIHGRDDDFDHVAAAINHMLDQIEQLMEGVREVSDAIAHDLKTPLARLRGQLELLLNIPERSDEAIESVIAESDQVLSAFNALLRIAQLEQGTRRQAFVHFDFRAVTDHARDMFEIVFAEKNIQFSIRADDDSYPVYGDRELWLQALSNLLDNAYKYTPEGGYIGIRLERGENVIVIEVRDSGPGIPIGERKNVFKRFYRLDKHRGTKGTGLGLSLVAAVCKVHRATIALDHGHGLVVRITMPLDMNADDVNDIDADNGTGDTGKIGYVQAAINEVR